MRERIVGMNLNGQRPFRKQQLEQQSRIWGFHIAALKPKLADRDTVSLDIAPGRKVCASPRLAHNPRAGMFDRHDVLLFAPSDRAGTTPDGSHFRTTRIARGPRMRRGAIGGQVAGALRDRWLLLTTADGYDAAYLLGRRCRFVGLNPASKSSQNATRWIPGGKSN